MSWNPSEEDIKKLAEWWTDSDNYVQINRDYPNDCRCCGAVATKVKGVSYYCTEIKTHKSGCLVLVAQDVLTGIDDVL